MLSVPLSSEFAPLKKFPPFYTYLAKPDVERLETPGPREDILGSIGLRDCGPYRLQQREGRHHRN